MLLRRLLLGTAAVIGEDDGSSGSAQEDEFVFALYVCVSLVLVLIAGLMSGLTLGLMSLDMVELEVRDICGDAAHGTRATTAAALGGVLRLRLQHTERRTRAGGSSNDLTRRGDLYTVRRS